MLRRARAPCRAPCAGAIPGLADLPTKERTAFIDEAHDVCFALDQPFRVLYVPGYPRRKVVRGVLKAVRVLPSAIRELSATIPDDLPGARAFVVALRRTETRLRALAEGRVPPQPGIRRLDRAIKALDRAGKRIGAFWAPGIVSG
jgi:hypothetical protein